MVTKRNPDTGHLEEVGDAAAAAFVAAVGSFSFPVSTEQARTAVDTNKSWKWVEDGPALKDAVKAAYLELRGQVEQQLNVLGIGWPQVPDENIKACIANVVRQWDDAFGWDAKNMTEHTEDAFYNFLSRQVVGGLRSEGL
jgi:hypothetical protein